MTASQPLRAWTDLPVVIWLRVGTDGVSVVFRDQPNVKWTVHQAVMINGRPRVTALSVEAAQPKTAVLLDEHRPAPLRYLAAIWARALNLGPGCQPMGFHLWDWLTTGHGARSTLDRKPDARLQKRDPDAYTKGMAEWTAPIATVVRAAAAQMFPIQWAVKQAFSASPARPFSDTYAEKLISHARDYHDLPKRGDRPE